MTIETLVVGGTLTLDTIVRAGETQRDVPGGSALYAAAAASPLLPVSIIGTAGSDFPFERLDPVWRRGVDRSGVESLDGPTFRWHARYDATGDHREIVSRVRGVAEGRLPPVPARKGTNYALLLGSTDPRIQGHVRNACRDARLAGLDSMSHHWRGSADALRALLTRVIIVFVNEEELALATGVTDGATAADALHTLGPELVVVKRGSRGAELHRRGTAPIGVGAVRVPRLVDPTGAGDAFAGAFMAALATHPERGDEHALRWAAAVASFAVESYGTDALVKRAASDVSRRMDSLVTMRP